MLSCMSVQDAGADDSGKAVPSFYHLMAGPPPWKKWSCFALACSCLMFLVSTKVFVLMFLSVWSICSCHDLFASGWCKKWVLEG